jgi:hypothetical protein
MRFSTVMLLVGPVLTGLGLALPATALAEVPETPAPAAAPGAPVGQAQMREDLRRFFREDRRHAAVLFGVGASTLIAGGVLVARPGFARATSYPLLGVGLLQAVIGAGIFLRTNAQMARLEAQLTNDPSALREAEHKRMTRLHRQYIAVEVAEGAMVVAGATLLGIGARQNRDVLAGIGLGLLIQGALTLPLDLIADHRGERYRGSLSRFQVGLAALPLPGAPPAGMRSPLALAVETTW